VIWLQNIVVDQSTKSFAIGHLVSEDRVDDVVGRPLSDSLEWMTGKFVVVYFLDVNDFIRPY
jgi:hypothetical protein